jgi:hypothetical protein
MSFSKSDWVDLLVVDLLARLAVASCISAVSVFSITDTIATSFSPTSDYGIVRLEIKEQTVDVGIGLLVNSTS